MRNYIDRRIHSNLRKVNTLFDSINIKTTGFKAPVNLIEGLERTITYEFMDKIVDQIFDTE
jgi:hypothetical protein